MDIADRLTATYREVRTSGSSDTADCALVLRRRFPRPVDTVWRAITEPDLIRAWFAPVTGHLRVGEAFEVEGHAEGTVLECVPPHLFTVTWDDETNVVVRLASDEQGDTVLELVHTGLPSDGAVRRGPMWDVIVASLDRFVSGDTADDLTTWRASAEVQVFAQHSVSAWVTATEASGVAAADDLADAVRTCLQRVAPDLTPPATA
ncbi:SRPBCC domain-containing protein [Saccharomonospora sp.]|uniref:SRPBCC domain-containing protein n=1 Tax=Saccharomonospora sp. TaxID=33913 RepID=UPI00262EDCA6|nr:SRPBCC domain-containing protein [Saccharomonospora sp.]